MTTRYTGFIPAAFTPCKDDGALDLGPIAEMAALFKEQKSPAAFVCGTTGEAHSFTVAERMQTAEAWLKAAPADLNVIVHVGHNCQVDSATLARHAKSIGAAAVAGLAPSYFKPSNIDDLIAFLRPIAAAADPLPFFYYDIPSMTGVSFPADKVMEKAAEVIPNFAGLKFTSNDLMRLQSCMAIAGERQVLFGSDEILLATLPLGIRGAVGSTYNYAAPVYRQILEAFDRGEHAEAARLQRLSVKLVEVLFEHGGLRTGKAIMSLIGIDCGPVRSPLRAVDAAERDAIRRKLASLPIFSRPVQ